MNLEELSHLVGKIAHSHPDHLKSFRHSHLDLLERKGFKEVTQDSYQFTNMTTFFEGLNLSGDVKGTTPQLDHLENIPTITFLNGELSKTDSLPEGITIKKISDYKPLTDHLKEANALSHLHHALINDGVVIEIGKNKIIDLPVRILHIITSSTLSAPTHFIEALPFSKVTIIEEYKATEDVSHGIVNETYIKSHAGSKVEHISLENENNDGLLHSSVFADVEKDATVRAFIFSASGKMNRSNLVVNLNAPGAHTDSYSLFLTNKKEHTDINTEIHHRAADTTSDQMAKGILSDESKGVFTGRIHILPQAQRVNSSQLNKNLLLSKKAQVHSCPQLEIFADDVKCSHGSTTGQLSPDEVFYFEARGIPEAKAKRLLSLGFCIEIVQKIENTHAFNYINHVVRKKLEEKFSLGNNL